MGKPAALAHCDDVGLNTVARKTSSLTLRTAAD
jgi:hypothetical protein